jgi:hypothetical protein
MVKKENSDIINASDIGQYYFCSIAWYLQKKGYKAESEDIKKGNFKHMMIGDVIDKTNQNIKKSYILKTIGFLFLIIAFINIFFEVFL